MNNVNKKLIKFNYLKIFGVIFYVFISVSFASDKKEFDKDEQPLLKSHQNNSNGLIDDTLVTQEDIPTKQPSPCKEIDRLTGLFNGGEESDGEHADSVILSLPSIGCTSPEPQDSQPTLHSFVVSTFNEISNVLANNAINISEQTLVVLDCDETIACRNVSFKINDKGKFINEYHKFFNDNDGFSNISNGHFNLIHLIGPDLFRTYKNVMKKANAMLTEEDKKHFNSIELIAAILIEKCKSKLFEQFSYQLLDDSLINFLTQVRDQGASVKICSGLPFDQYKKQFLQTSALKLSEEDYYYARNSKVDAIASIQNHLFGAQRLTFNQIIFIDNSERVIKDFKKKAASTLNVDQVISIHFKYYDTITSPEGIIREFRLLATYLALQPIGQDNKIDEKEHSLGCAETASSSHVSSQGESKNNCEESDNIYKKVESSNWNIGPRTSLLTEQLSKQALEIEGDFSE